MANPTTYYGFVLPTPSDLVTDLPADFDVALQGVDTRLKALNPSTTLGDTNYASATANTNTRLAIGTSGQVLTVSGGVPAWVTPSAGAPAWTRVANGSLTGSSISVSSLSSAEILISLASFSQSGATTAPMVRVNGNSTSGTYGVQNNENSTGINMNGSSASNGKGFCYIAAANTTAIMKFAVANLYPSYINLSSAITSIEIFPNGGSGTWNGGTYEVWTR